MLAIPKVSESDDDTIISRKKRASSRPCVQLLLTDVGVELGVLVEKNVGEDVVVGSTVG